jgi:hypothetical protein
MNRLKQALELLSVILLIIIFNCCRTAKNGYSRMPRVKYDFDCMSAMKSKLIKTNDTVIVLQFGNGSVRGTQHNFYSIVKKGKRTEIHRVSNFQKFKKQKIVSFQFPWLYIIDNSEKFKLDTIKNYREIKNADGSISYQDAPSYGRTISVHIRLGNYLHNELLFKEFDTRNKGNSNLDLIEKVRALVDSLNYVPKEQGRYKWER